MDQISVGIGPAISALLNGRCVRRRGWNGKGMFLRLVAAAAANALPYVEMSTATGQRVPWTCSQSDLLADDWEVLPSS